ncbi:MAG TPA: twin-arginine translocase TatA/TatE family subunit [Actinomycetota bacterium]|nr:twin-arginine translocase TatA/TatE family subunit [Actinomycetota bacterium]
MFNLGPGEILVILVLALLIFGPKRLPEIGRSIGKSMREFRRASSELRDEFENLGEEKTRPAAPRQAPGSTPGGPSGNGPRNEPPGNDDPDG